MLRLLRFALPLLPALLLSSGLQALPLTPYGSANSLIRITNGVADANCNVPTGNECASAVDFLPVANYSDPGFGPIVGGGSVEAGVLHGYLSSAIGGNTTTVNSVSMDVDARDQFTVDGTIAGETISITAHLLVAGVVDITTSLGANSATAHASIGTGWNGTYGGISAFKATASDFTGYITSNSTIPLSAEAIYTFDVVTGTSFQLSYGMQLDTRATYTGGMTEADFLNTATLSFDLPAGYTISSLGGYGVVPEPATTLLLGIGLAGLVVAGWRRR